MLLMNACPKAFILKFKIDLICQSKLSHHSYLQFLDIYDYICVRIYLYVHTYLVVKDLKKRG